MALAWEETRDQQWDIKELMMNQISSMSDRWFLLLIKSMLRGIYFLDAFLSCTNINYEIFL